MIPVLLLTRASSGSTYIIGSVLATEEVNNPVTELVNVILYVSRGHQPTNNVLH